MGDFNAIEFGNRLTELRESKDETQSDITTMLGYKSHQQVSYIENGTRKPTLEHIIKIAQHYNVSTDYLLGLTEAKTSDKGLQAVCDFTGLSEIAIERLHSLNEINKKEDIKLLELHFKIIISLLEQLTVTPTLTFEIEQIVEDNNLLLKDFANDYYCWDRTHTEKDVDIALGVTDSILGKNYNLKRTFEKEIENIIDTFLSENGCDISKIEEIRKHLLTPLRVKGLKEV